MLPKRRAVCTGDGQSANSLMLEFTPYFEKALSYLRNVIPLLLFVHLKNAGIVHIFLNFTKTVFCTDAQG